MNCLPACASLQYLPDSCLIPWAFCLQTGLGIQQTLDHYLIEGGVPPAKLTLVGGAGSAAL